MTTTWPDDLSAAYLVHCGATTVVVHQVPFLTDAGARACALWHADVHACTPWIEPPLDHK